MLKRLEAVSSEYRIQKPKTPSEFEIQAELFWKLKAAGLDVHGEVVWEHRTKQGTIKRCEKCRFDIVIFKDGAASEVLEVKDGKVRHKSGVEQTRQGKRYTRYGVPVTFIYGPEGAAQYLESKFTGGTC